MKYFFFVKFDLFLIGSTHLSSLDPQKLHNRYICQEHFPPESFMNPNDQKKLVCTAIPYKRLSKELLSLSSGNNIVLNFIIESFQYFFLKQNI